jgi:uncharacterized membrane protein
MADTSLSVTRPGGQPVKSGTAACQNVGEAERFASVLGGGLLALYGMFRGSPGGLLLTALGGGLLYRGLSGHCPLYQAMGVSTTEKHGPATSVPAGKGVKVEKTVVINRPAAELYRFWRNLSNLPRFMQHIRYISVQGKWSRWMAKGPLGFNVAWDAEIITDRPNEVLAWRSLEGSDVDNAGSVHFEPEGANATRVTVTLKYNPPAGRLGAAIAHVFGQDLEPLVEDDMQRFKQLMESGELPRETKSSGSRASWQLP